MITDSISRVYLAVDPVDFRKGVNGLSNLVQDHLGMDPFDGALVIFSNRQHNKLKCLWYDQTGFWMFYKRLNKGTFKWPKDQTERLEISEQQLEWLLQGLDIHQKRAFKKVRPADV